VDMSFLLHLYLLFSAGGISYVVIWSLGIDRGGSFSSLRNLGSELFLLGLGVGGIE
jgi:hypothetical protein